jgi:hypothetical protein
VSLLSLFFIHALCPLGLLILHLNSLLEFILHLFHEIINSLKLFLIQNNGTQSRQSAKLFLQSSELGLPQPFTRRRVCPPSPGSGGRSTLAGEREVGRVPIPTRGHTLWYFVNGSKKSKDDQALSSAMKLDPPLIHPPSPKLTQ